MHRLLLPQTPHLNILRFALLITASATSLATISAIILVMLNVRKSDKEGLITLGACGFFFLFTGAATIYNKNIERTFERATLLAFHFGLGGGVLTCLPLIHSLRRFLSEHSVEYVDKHLSSVLLHTMSTLPCLLYLIGESLGCIWGEGEKKEGRSGRPCQGYHLSRPQNLTTPTPDSDHDTCFTTFLSNSNVLTYLSGTIVLVAMTNVAFKETTLESLTFFTDATIYNFARIVGLSCGAIAAFTAFGLRTYMVRREVEGENPILQDTTKEGKISYESGHYILHYILCAELIIILAFMGVGIVLMPGIRAMRDYTMMDVHDDEEASMKSYITRIANYLDGIVNLETFKVKESFAYISPLYDIGIIIFSVGWSCLFVGSGFLLLAAPQSLAYKVGALLFNYYAIGWIPQALLLIVFYLGNLEQGGRKRRSHAHYRPWMMVVMKFSMGSMVFIRIVVCLIVGQYAPGFLWIGMLISLIMYGTYSEATVDEISRTFTLRRRREHLAFLLKVVAVSFPTQFYFTSEIAACELRQLFAWVYHPDLVQFDIGNTNCSSLYYSIAPLALWNALHVGQYALHGIWNQYTASIEDTSTLSGSRYKNFKAINTGVTGALAMFCYAIRSEEPFDKNVWTTSEVMFIVCFIPMCFDLLVIFLVRLSRGGIKGLRENIFSVLRTAKLQKKKSQKSSKRISSIEDRLDVGACKSLWDGGTKGLTGATLGRKSDTQNEEEGQRKKGPNVFEISPGFL